jgi:transcription elongation factor GreA
VKEKDGNMQKVPMTIQGANLLQEELHHLKAVQRPQIITAIAEARAHGDLRENAEYHAAKERQGFIEGRVSELETKLANAQIIDITKLPNNGRVVFGATVHLVNIETDEKAVYQIVGDDEADIKLGKVSVSSPLARALVGRQTKEEVKVQTPNGVAEYEIEAVDYI